MARTPEAPVTAEVLVWAREVAGLTRDDAAHSLRVVPWTTHPGRLKAPTISASVRQWMLDAGVKHHAFDGRSAHAWRHTALTELAEATHDPYVVQEFAGRAATVCAVTGGPSGSLC